MKISPFIFRNYDIRGKAGEDLDAEKVEAIGKAYGTYLQKRKIYDIVLGYDCRITGEEYTEAFLKGVTSCGIDVINLGLVMTQMVYFSQYVFQTNGGAMITASHNPSGYNGFKLAISYSLTTGPEEVEELRVLVENEQFFVADMPGKVTKEDVRERYICDLLKRVRIKKQFKVVLDSHHGTTGIYMPEILRRAGCEVVEMMTTPDGHFPAGTPDPTDAHALATLKERVIKEKADLGLSMDGDGDRIGLIDDKGRILWNDIALAIFAQEILERFPKSKIIYNTLCSRLVPELIKARGGKPIIWRTGHSFIKAKIAEENAAFGGELSGHFFFKDNAYGHDDGSYAALRILEYLAEKGEKLSHVFDSFPKYISSPEIKIGCPDNRKFEVIAALSPKFKSDFPLATVTDASIIPGDDGVRVDLDDGMIIFRSSQNGPYITVRFEAKEQNVYDERRDYVHNTLKEYPEMVWGDELCVNLDALERKSESAKESQ